MKQYPTITVRRSVEGPRYVGSPNDPVYDEIVMKDEIPDLPDGTYALVPVDALVIERVMDTDGWTEHNDPCDDPPYPGGCRLEIVRPGKVQCECDNLPECDECGCPEHAAVCNGFGWDQHLAVAIPCDCNNRKDNQ